MLEKLLTMVEVPLPEAAVSDELLERRGSIEQQLAYAGLTEEEYLESEGQSADEFAQDLDKRVRDSMAAQFVLDDIATAESLAVSEQELTEHMLRRAQQSGQSPDAYIRHAMEHNHVPEYVAEIRRGKALALVVESAVVTDSAGDAVELKTLLPDGTYGDPNAIAEAADEADEAASTQADRGRRAGRRRGSQRRRDDRLPRRVAPRSDVPWPALITRRPRHARRSHTTLLDSTSVGQRTLGTFSLERPPGHSWHRRCTARTAIGQGEQTCTRQRHSSGPARWP